MLLSSVHLFDDVGSEVLVGNGAELKRLLDVGAEDLLGVAADLGGLLVGELVHSLQVAVR